MTTTAGNPTTELSRIIERVGPLAVLGDPSDVQITDVVFDSREVSPGALFCCVPGAHHDGHEFAAAARAAGAVAFICEHSLPSEVAPVQLVVAPGLVRPAMARAACAFFGEPARAMRTVGVTGTNGKTTTTYLLRSIFEQAGLRAGVIGTLDGARTTPESPHLQRALARQRDAGCVASAIEVSSHSLVQHRVDGIVFDAAIFTNLSQDHLDFHETMEAYFAAKAELFRPERAKVAVVNRDDPYGQRLIDRPLLPTIAYSLEDVRDLVIGVRATQFRLGRHLVRFALGGRFNVYNALAAAAAARALGIEADQIVAGLERARPVAGRFETFTGSGVTAVVDYAHTPAGLEEVLRAARHALVDTRAPRPDARVLVVFGCGGERDRGKRPAMGAVAAALSDVVIVTSDNPRSEDAAAIASDITAGISGHDYVVELDRRRAIARALDLAQPGDVVVVAGKGHETTQQFKDRVVPFDDREVVIGELARLEAPNGITGPHVIAIFTSGGVALLISGFGTPILLRWLTRHRIGQQIREDGPASHATKVGTPVMGGIAIILSVVAGYCLAHIGTKTSFSPSGVLVIGAVVATGFIGLRDDWLKVSRRRSLGLNKRTKFGLQVAVGAGFSLLAVYWAHASTTLSFTRFDVPAVELGTAGWVLWSIVMIVASSNAVNLTDGLDGLAAGSSAFAAGVFTLIGYWDFRHLRIYQVGPALDLALAAVAIVGACVGFLWWNAAPARIFMGDTGSLALGAGLACLALELNVQLLLPIVGGLFVIETMSVVAQVISFRFFHTRIFRMAPLHHHFELLGWPETTVIVRLWVFSALFAVLGLGIFYTDFLQVPGR